MLCDNGKLSVLEKSLWVRVVSLPIHLRKIATYQVIGDWCGGFAEADKLSVTGVVRLQVRSSGRIPTRVSL